MVNNKNGGYIFASVKVGEKGQIVIPKEARDLFNIKPGDTLIITGKEKEGLFIPCNIKISELFSSILNNEKK